MQIVAVAIFPIALMIIFGNILKRKYFTNDHFWDGLDKLVYFVLLPALFFRSISHSSFTSESLTIAVIFVISFLSVTVLNILIQKFYPTDAPSFTSVFQGSVRFNNYIGFSLGLILFGNQSIGFIVSIGAVGIPVVNALCTYVFHRYLPTEDLSFWQIIKKVLSNPFVVSCLCGAVFSYFSIVLPTIIDNSIKMLADASLPLGLLGVGAGLKFRINKKYYSDIAIASVLKLLIMPLVAFALTKLIPIENHYALLSLMLMALLPNAASSYVTSKHISGNSNLMSQIIFIEILISFFTIPLILGLLHN